MARLKYCVVVAVILVLKFTARANEPEKLLLTIYYESKCSDSKQFILEQLVPTVSRLEDYLILKFIPFGKADSIDQGAGGFECQHGPSECRGNIVQDCTLHIMRDRPYIDMVSYVACEMTKKAGTRNSSECIEEADVPTEAVENCLLSGQGTALQLHSEYLTKLIKPKFIATVTVNGADAALYKWYSNLIRTDEAKSYRQYKVFNQEIQDSSQKDLMGTLCSFLEEVPPCVEYQNKVALSQILYEIMTS